MAPRLPALRDADDGGQLGELLALLVDALLQAAVGLLGGPPVGHDQVRAQRGRLLHVDLAPLLAEHLDAGQVQVLQVGVGRDGLVGVDADGLDAEGDERGGLAGVGDDPAGDPVRPGRLAGAVRERP
ncbi:MAG: hypothetical protein HOY71_27230 [Nonomuraea sp.]|nr:hypothetical protein [Nonomuraea sp.]